MADLSATLSLPGVTSWAYDPSRGLLNLLTSDGKLHGWNIQDRAFAYRVDLGFTPSSADISADGRYLVVGDAKTYLSSPPTALEKTYDAQIARVDLNTIAIDPMRFKVTSFESGVADVAVTADGKVLATMDVNGSGWGGVRSLDLTSTGSNLTVERVQGYSVSDGASLIGSASDRYVLVQANNSSPSYSQIYDSVAGRLVAEGSGHALGVSSQWGTGDISEARGQVVAVGSKTVVYDLPMTAQTDLSVYNAKGSVAAAAYSPDGSKLYLWHGAESHVTIVDTTSWVEVGNLDLTLTTEVPNWTSRFKFDMDVTADGRLLITEYNGAVELVDVQARTVTQLTPVHLTGGADADMLRGGSANDTLAAGDGLNTVRGGFGDDTIDGGAQFDDLHGNQGRDLMHGWDGDDWVVGGKGNDQLFGDAGFDIVYGNIGADTVEGGAGSDWVRGGQNNDIVRGGDGDDWISGDMGNDTLYGGSGADTFHTFREAAFDIVFDFKGAEGDRVQLLAGTIYTVSQRGADTVIAMENVGSLTLSNVQLSSLPPGWLFEA